MNLRVLLIQKGLRQIEIAKLLGANHTLVSLQINKHRLLPEKYQDKFCELLGITKEDLRRFMENGEVQND